MTTDAEPDEPIPAWLPHAVLHAIRSVAGEMDPARAGAYAGVDVERVRRAIDRGDRILAAHRGVDDDAAIDTVLAREALIVARAMIRPRTGNANG